MNRNIIDLRPFALHLTRFTWNSAKGTLTTFASDLGSCSDEMTWLRRLYNDAYDVGIGIRSGGPNGTDKVETFYLEREEEDAEGDLVALHFKPLDAKSRVKSVTIFND